MKVLHVITGLTAGGAEEQLRLLLQHSRHDASVVTLTGMGSVGRRMAADGVPVHTLTMRSNRDVRVLGALVRLMRRGGYGVVHAHLYRGFVYGRPAARLARVPVVIGTEHSIGTQLIEGVPVTGRIRLLYRATGAPRTVTVAVSDTVRDRLLRWGVRPDLVPVIPNGIDAGAIRRAGSRRQAVRAELGVAGGTVLLGTVGRLEASKAVDDVIAAAAPMLGAGVRLLVVGDGRCRAALEQQAEQLGVLPYVIFTGERGDVPELYAAMDASINPSVTETFGLAVVEALLAGLPVIYRTCPAIDDLPGPLPPGAVQVGPTVADLRLGICGLLDSGVRRYEPVTALLRRYDIRSVAAEIDGLYDRLADSRPTRRLHRMRGYAR